MQLEKKLFRLAVNSVLAYSLFAPPSASAWDGVQTSTIASMDVTSGSNYGFRISLAGVTNMCIGGPGWAYLKDTDSNYKVYVAALMLAKAQGSRVTLYTTTEGSYCHIGYIAIY